MNVESFIVDDTKQVLSGHFYSSVIREGVPTHSTPIFDRLAADRFGRDEENT